jgi:hypothetical protein
MPLSEPVRAVLDGRSVYIQARRPESEVRVASSHDGTKYFHPVFTSPQVLSRNRPTFRLDILKMAGRIYQEDIPTRTLLDNRIPREAVACAEKSSRRLR